MSVNGGPTIIENGLVMYLDAANNKSYTGTGTAWRDLSGNNNSATLVNSPVYSNGVFTFNGTTMYAAVPSNAGISLATPTVIIGCTVATGTPIAKGGYGDYWNFGITNITNTGFQVRHQNGDASSPSFTTKSGFNIFAYVATGTTAEFYRNGVFGGSNNTNYSPDVANRLSIWIGSAYSDTLGQQVEYYSGSIAFVQLYNRPLSKAEIWQNFNAFAPRFNL